MADNVILNPGAGGSTIATDDIGGVQHELVKVEFGSDGAATMVDASNPLPVTDAVAEEALNSIAAEDFATHAAQIDNSQKTQLVDAAGNQVTVTGNKLDVNATFSGDIEIGSVELKNATTDDRAAVINADPTTEFGLVTRNIPSGTQPVSGTVALGAGSQVIGHVIVDSGGGGGAVTIADGADVAEGATADAVIAAGAAGTLSAKLRAISRDLIANIVLAAGTNLIGKVGIDQTTPGTTNAVSATGNVAHDAVDSGNPVKVGQKAISFGTNPTAVASGDRTDWYANIAGIPFMIGGHPNIVCFRATYTSAQTDTAIVTIAGGLKIVVTRLTVTASAANTVNVSVIVGFGTANTPTTTGVVLSHPGLAPGSGVVEGNGAGILGVGADGSDLRITSAVPTSGAIDVVVNYFTIES